MIRLRPFKLSDSIALMRWIEDENSFAMWCANKFKYPLTHEQLYSYYQNYECDENAWIMTALDHIGKPVGHFLMRKADYQQESIHLGFVIMDTAIRGKGYGKEMLNLAVKYAFELLKVHKVTLAVFDNNPSAINCYKSIGFEVVLYTKLAFQFGEERWGVYDMEITNNNDFI